MITILADAPHMHVSDRCPQCFNNPFEQSISCGLAVKQRYGTSKLALSPFTPCTRIHRSCCLPPATTFGVNCEGKLCGCMIDFDPKFATLIHADIVRCQFPSALGQVFEWGCHHQVGSGVATGGHFFSHKDDEYGPDIYTGLLSAMLNGRHGRSGM